MASQAGFVVENKFINGLITESTALNFPQDACTDTQNCVFTEFGLVTRRPGLDMETGGARQNYTQASGDVYQDYVWYTSAATSNQAYLIQQIGKNLYFYDITDNITPSMNPATIINLDTYLPVGSTLSSAQVACQFATGNGDLLITNQNTNPVYVNFNETTQAPEVTAITIKHRDTDGIKDGLRVDERPSETIASLKTNNPNHYYNSLNQGWYNADAFGQWDANRTDLPSNADAVSYTRASLSDAFSDDMQFVPGNSPAPKGHFILNVGEDDRVTAAAAEGFSGFSLTGQTSGSSQISASLGTIIGNLNVRTAAAFDGNIKQGTGSAAGISGTSGYIGKNYSAQGGFKCSGVLIYAGDNVGFAGGTAVPMVIELYGKTTLPTSATDGTLIGTTGSFTDAAGSKFIACTSPTTTYNYLWVRIRRVDGVSDSLYIAELQFFTGAGSFYRPRCVAFYAGRSFFAGVDGTDTGANVYFSQVVTDKTKYGLCYQSNDPTSEKFADLLATDGGVIKIPEMGKVQRLFPFQNALLVFANNGVWLVSGNGSDGFAATGYRVRRLSNIGMTSPNSVVDVKGVPMWWAEDGIYTVNYDPNYDSSSVKTLTEETIKSLVLAVPGPNRQYIRATFDRLNNYVYFGFLSTADNDGDITQTFDRLLVFNAKTSAFFLWTLDNTSTNTPAFCGMEFITDGNRILGGKLKLSTQVMIGAQRSITYSDFSDITNWKDYTTIMALNSKTAIDYSSYLIAGYRIDAQAMRNFQSKYVWTFMEDAANSSVRLQGLWDFSNNQASGKWSTAQQAYNSLTTKGRMYDDVRISRRVVRGTGKALQVKYYSETGKPFSLIGWGIYETGNDAP